MAILSNDQLGRLAAYTPARQAHIVPLTNQGEIYKSACWNWALTGGTVNAAHPNGAPNIYERIIQFNYYDPQGIYAVGINNVDAQFPGCAAHFAMLRANLANARAGNALAQRNYKVAMMSIAAQMNGLTPLGDGNHYPYTLHMRTSQWWGWDHWGLGIRVPPNNNLIYVQKVPDTCVYHACTSIWDEGLSLTSIGINELRQEHVTALGRVGNMLACSRCGKTARTRAIAESQRWRECRHCGRYYCRQCKHSLSFGFIGTFTRTRTCDCSRGTRRMY